MAHGLQARRAALPIYRHNPTVRFRSNALPFLFPDDVDRQREWSRLLQVYQKLCSFFALGSGPIKGLA